MLNDQQLRSVAFLTQSARRILFITGAGVSAESGIPTFRGAGAAFPDGKTEDGIPFEEALSGWMLKKNPALSWKYFFRLEEFLRDKVPNAAHHAMARLQAPDRDVWIATQNIDGLHQAAGSTHVLELHGNLRRIVCTRCDYLDFPATFQGFSPVPRCPRCSAMLRPDAVLYGENLPERDLATFLEQQEKGFDIVFSVGTTSIFPYISMPMLAASRQGIPTVEINPDPTSISDYVQFTFPNSAAQTLRSLLDSMDADAD